MNKTSFEGFSDETVDFLWGIRFHNEREWFLAHKDTYQSCLYDPMKALSREVYERFQAEFQVPGLCSKVSRIYRDARRLHGRGPYKDHLWFSLGRPAGEQDSRPCLWFELQPEGWSYGLGCCCVTPLTMAKFRARLDRDPKGFSTLARKLGRQDTFTLGGEDYKRPKGDPGALLSPWYNKRWLSLRCERPVEPLLNSHELADTILEGFRFLLPYYEYFVSLDGDPDPRQA